jgi:hypothetical protein
MMKCPDSIIAHVRGPYYDAVKELREHGEIPCMFLTMKYDPARDEVDQVQTVAVYDLDTADKKDSAAQTIQEFIQTNHANCVVMIADAWKAPAGSKGPPREDPQRKEVLAVHIELDAIGKWGCAREYTRIGKQAFIESAMPEIKEILEPDWGRFVFFKSSRAVVFNPEVLSQEEHDKELADDGVRRVAYAQNASASELAAAIREAGCPVAVTYVELRDGLAYGHLCGIQPVRPQKVDGHVVVMAAHPGTGNPIACDELAGALEEHGDAKVVVEIDGHPYRLYSVLVGNGRAVIVLNGRID